MGSPKQPMPEKQDCPSGQPPPQTPLPSPHGWSILTTSATYVSTFRAMLPPSPMRTHPPSASMRAHASLNFRSALARHVSSTGPPFAVAAAKRCPECMKNRRGSARSFVAVSDGKPAGATTSWLRPWDLVGASRHILVREDRPVVRVAGAIHEAHRKGYSVASSSSVNAGPVDPLDEAEILLHDGERFVEVAVRGCLCRYAFPLGIVVAPVRVDERRGVGDADGPVRHVT